jgi:hypothetical protein
MSHVKIEKESGNKVKTRNFFWRYKFIFLSCLLFLSIFLFLKTGWLLRNLDNDIQRAAESDIRKYRQYSTEIRLKLYGGNFDLLDNIAAELRTTKERFPGGAWKLSRFYIGIADVESEGTSSEAEWKTLIGKLEQWSKERSDSLTARVALAQAYTNYAWKARGRGYADTVTEESFRLFHERMDRAEKILNEAKKLPGKCPNWYVVMQAVALGQGWSLEKYNELFNEAVALEPLYPYFYYAKATYLLPKWNGERGDWERFAEEAAEKIGGKEGSMLYYCIVSNTSDYYSQSYTLFNEAKPSWPKLKQGYIDLESLQGTGNYNLNKICLLACLANDKPTAQAYFERIGNNYDPYVWKQERRFYNYKAWASEKLMDRLKVFLLE